MKFFSLILSFSFMAISFAAEVKSQDFKMGARFIEFLDSGKFKEVYALFDPGFTEETVVPQLKRTWTTLTSFYGPLEEILTIAAVPEEEGQSTVYMKLKFQRKETALKIHLSQRRKIRRFDFSTPEEIPTVKEPDRIYSFPDRFEVVPYSFGASHTTIRGKFYKPKNTENWPVVVFAHDFGPHDMFHQTGIHRLFLDFAEGLASNGVGVILYPKRSLLYEPPKSGITPDWEVLQDLYNIAYQFRINPNLKNHALILATYGFSNWFAPYLAQKKLFSGHILLNPSFRNPLTILFEQKEFESASDPGSYDQLQKLHNRIQTFLKNPQSDETHSFFEYPADYFRRLEIYKPSQLKSTATPFLVLQAGNDHIFNPADQPVLEDILEKSKAEFHRFPELNRIFHVGEKLQPTADYFTPGIVSPGTLGVILKWIRAHYPRK